MEAISIGSEVGYESTAQGALQPGETRTVSLASVPPDATSALVLVTTREATKKGEVRIGTPDKSATATMAFPKKGVRSSVMVVPVSGGQVAFEAPKAAALQVRVEVFNIANRLNYENPAATLPNGTPGVPFTDAQAGTFGYMLGPLNRTVGLGTARQTQVSIRYSF